MSNTGSTDRASVADQQAEYYGELYRKHDYSPQAVASGKQIYKDLRYQRLSKVFENDQQFSLFDVGMGLGHYYEYLKSHFPERRVNYAGSEVVPEFHQYCCNTYPESQFFLSDLSQAPTEDTYDYFIFGGTFYHPVRSKRSEWEDFVFAMLKNSFYRANKGIAVNFITEYCDFFDRDLYYAKLSRITDFVQSSLSRFFSIDHSYALYEYTLLVYREEYIASKFPEDDFKKYFMRQST